jgi:DNA-binding NarL/FixJ family response regulator
MAITDRPALRVVVADDDAFTLSLVSDGLRAQGFEVWTALTIVDAWTLVSDHDPHALVTDLNFGPGGSGATLLQRVNHEFPWVGLVVLTSHLSPELAVDDAAVLPDRVVYLVKSHLRNVDQLAGAVTESIAGRQPEGMSRHDAADGDAIVITIAQADVLRLLATGASTKALAEHRGTTVRAAESMLARLYAALGIADDDRSNPRVSAVKLWEQGRISVR